MSVTHKKKEYLASLSHWHQVRDCIAGDDRLKQHDYNAQSLLGSGALNLSFWNDNYNGVKSDSYLRIVNVGDRSKDNQARNLQYIKCAVFANFTKHTATGMTGMMLRTPPEIELNPTIEYLENDADGSGQNLEQQIKSTAGNVVGVGRHGLLVDFPAVDKASSPTDVKNGQRAYIDTYKAEQIINWRTEKFGAITKLVLVVLAENRRVVDEDDEFSDDTEIIYRVLKLVGGKYVQEIHHGKDEVDVIDSITDGKGNSLDFIPFQFVGSDNNLPEVSSVTMFDISVVNIGHYRNSADVEENSFFASQMTLTATGMTEQWIKDVWKGQAQVGSRAVLTGPEGAAFGAIQATESNLARALMEDKEKQAVQLGAKLIEPAQGDKTATQAEIDSADDSSILSTIAANVEDAYINAIGWVQLFMNDSGDFELELNKKFGVAQLSAQEILALSSAMQTGGLSLDSFLWNMKQGRRLSPDIDIKKEKALIEAGELGMVNETTTTKVATNASE